MRGLPGIGSRAAWDAEETERGEDHGKDDHRLRLPRKSCRWKRDDAIVVTEGCVIAAIALDWPFRYVPVDDCARD